MIYVRDVKDIWDGSQSHVLFIELTIFCPTISGMHTIIEKNAGVSRNNILLFIIIR